MWDKESLTIPHRGGSLERSEAIARNLQRLIEAANDERRASGKRLWSNRSLSLAAGGSPTLVRDLLEQRSNSPKISTLENLARALCCTVSDLTGEQYDPLAHEIVDQTSSLSPEEKQQTLQYIAWLKSRRAS